MALSIKDSQGARGEDLAQACADQDCVGHPPWRYV